MEALGGGGLVGTRGIMLDWVGRGEEITRASGSEEGSGVEERGEERFGFGVVVESGGAGCVAELKNTDGGDTDWGEVLSVTSVFWIRRRVISDSTFRIRWIQNTEKIRKIDKN